MTLSCLFLTSQIFAQSSQTDTTETTSVRGTVVNSVTREGIGRALVSSPDNRFATLTDSEGHFEFMMPASSEARGGSQPGRDGVVVHHPTVNRLDSLVARKPGFLEDHVRPTDVSAAGKDFTVTLVPEALVVGRVVLPSSDPSDKIRVELYRRQVQDGRAHWARVGSIASKSNGEFRFADLSAGSYKLLTDELLDRDPLTFDPRGQVYGYPPVYSPAAKEFASGETFQLSPGKTFQTSISLVRQPYYQVKIPVLNAPAGGLRVTVSAQGRGPGYALGYNDQEQTIEGMLPNGSYTLEASSFGVNSVSGVVHISVRGTAVEGPRMILTPNGSIPVNVEEEFTSSQNPGATTWSSGGHTFSVKGPRLYLNVHLEPADDFGSEQAATLRGPTGPEDESLILDNVHPGRYWVRINSSVGFTSSVTYGGKDLQREPIVVGAGGSNASLEIVMSDNGAEVEGFVEGVAKPPSDAGTFGQVSRAISYESAAHVYLVPQPDSGGEFREAWVSPDGTFNLQQVPPGTYRVLAFDHTQPELEYRDAEAMRAYEAKGQVLRFVAGKKEQLRLQVIATGE